MSRLTARFTVDYPGFRLDARLDVPARGVTVVFGPSGCGKTTLLRCLAGLERSPDGYLQVDAETWQDEVHGNFLPVHRRPLGMVFQEARLFPHLTVRGNLEYGLKRVSRLGSAFDLAGIVALLDLEPLLERRPQRLSGGEQQRVALGRALLTHPRLLLLDEPLANLDLARKQEILPFLLRVRRELNVPMIYVSHSLTEVLQLVDTLVWLENGRVAACGPVNEVLSRLDDGPAARFPLKGAVLETRVEDHDREFALTRVRLGGHFLHIPLQPLEPGAPLRLHLLAQDISIHRGPPAAPTSVLNILPARVIGIGPVVESEPSVTLQLDVGVPVLATITRKSLHYLGLKPGQDVYAHIKAVRTVHALEEY